MKHHPKSNNGVFSKKQKKASRVMMATRTAFSRRDRSRSSFNMALPDPTGMMATIGALLFGMKGLRRRMG